MIRAQLAALLLVGLGQVCQAQQKQQESPATNVDLNRFLPPNATLVMQLAVHRCMDGVSILPSLSSQPRGSPSGRSRYST